MKILIVDDDAIVIRSCTRILEEQQFEITCVASADDALESARKTGFDLLLIDVVMPRHNGKYLLTEFKKISPDTPVIVMSGYSTPETISEMFRLGADKFIPKPFRPDELMEAIRQVLQKRRSSKSITETESRES